MNYQKSWNKYLNENNTENELFATISKELTNKDYPLEAINRYIKTLISHPSQDLNTLEDYIEDFENYYADITSD